MSSEETELKKTNGNVLERETLTAEIEFCEDDWVYLQQQLSREGMDVYQVTDENSDGPDPLLVASTSIIRVAILALGIETLVAHGGCPLCTFRDIVPIISRSIALGYSRSH